MCQSNPDTGVSMRNLPTVPGAQKLTLSPDGTQLWVAAAAGSSSWLCANQLAVFDLATGALLRKIALPGTPGAILFNSGGIIAYVLGSMNIHSSSATSLWVAEVSVATGEVIFDH